MGSAQAPQLKTVRLTNVNYLDLFVPYNVAEIRDWLLEAGELYVDLFFSRRGMGGVGYRIRSLSDLKELISKQDWPDIAITIFRKIQYPIRGTANNELLYKAIANIPDDSEFSIISLDVYYPSHCLYLGSGDNHDDLISEFKTLDGKRIAAGIDPDPTMKLAMSNPEEVMYFSVLKNRYGYQPFKSRPELYTDSIRDWFE